MDHVRKKKSKCTLKTINSFLSNTPPAPPKKSL